MSILYLSFFPLKYQLSFFLMWSIPIIVILFNFLNQPITRVSGILTGQSYPSIIHIIFTDGNTGLLI